MISKTENREKPWVHLISQDTYNLEEIMEKIKNVITHESINFKDKSVLLKVSFVFPVRDPERVKMIITNPHFIAATAGAIVEHGASAVYIADGETFGCARYAFDIVGMPGILKKLPKAVRKKIHFCYLDEVKKEWITPQNNFCPDVKIDFPSIVRNVDIFISLPKLKVNIFADVTLSVKNGMGFICRDTRLKYHNENLHGLIADIFQVRPPDYIITDAIYAGEAQGPMEATPYQDSLIIFGNNGPAVDSLCCRIMGYAPLDIKHLRLLHEAGYGPVDEKKIRIENRKLLKERQHDFIHPESDMGNLDRDIICYNGTCCESGCKPFMRAILDGYGMNRGWESLKGTTIILGKGLDIPADVLKKLKKRRTIVYGKCAEPYKKYGTYYRGCPPDYINALITLPLRTGLGLTPWLKYVEPWTYVKSQVLHFFSLVRGKR